MFRELTINFVCFDADAIIESICFDHLLFEDNYTPRISTIFKIVPSMISFKFKSLNVFEIRITSVIIGLNRINHFRAHSLSLRKSSPHVTTLFTKSLRQAIKFAFIFFAANLTRSLLIS